jgi:hypothetical protein
VGTEHAGCTGLGRSSRGSAHHVPLCYRVQWCPPPFVAYAGVRPGSQQRRGNLVGAGVVKRAAASHVLLCGLRAHVNACVSRQAKSRRMKTTPIARYAVASLQKVNVTIFCVLEHGFPDSAGTPLCRRISVNTSSCFDQMHVLKSARDQQTPKYMQNSKHQGCSVTSLNSNLGMMLLLTSVSTNVMLLPDVCVNKRDAAT